MKRHNAKAIAAAVAIAAAAASPETKKKSEPKPTMSAAALYVDVVKNMTKAETPPSATSPLPKFTILHEDFPALPGTVEETTRVVHNANVPDDWTDIICDNDELNDDEDDGDEDDDVDGDVDDEPEDIDDDEQSASPSPSVDSVSEKPESLPEATEPDPSIPDLLLELHRSSSSNNKSSESSEHDAPVVVHVSASTDHSNANSNGSEWQHSPKCKHFRPNFCESFFEPQFLIDGMKQRASQRPMSNEVKTQLGPPPGFEGLVYYGRLCTNRMGMPLGGVTFDNVAIPATAANNAQLSSGEVLKDAFGMAGLARNLQAAQQNPRLVQQLFGHNVAYLKVYNHCSAHEGNKLHATFGGALMGGRCPPHEVQHNVPPYYYRWSVKALPQPKMDQMESELLFLFFYTYPNDMLQMLAAAELADRGWRYHIEERLWIRRQPDNPHYVASRCQESGEYNYFNMMHWKIMPRHFELLPGQLEQTITKAELYEQYGYHPQMSFF